MGFLSLWFVILTYFAILWANMTSLPLFSRFFLGDVFRFGFHYNIFGYEVWFGETLLSICAVILIGLLCAKSTRIPDRIMIIAALTFAVGFTVCACLAIMGHDASFSYAPLYTEGSSAFSHIVRIAAISPWAFIGFENISHFSEEYNFETKKVRGILISSVLVTTALYIFVSLLSVSAYPPEYASWLDYIRDMGNLEGIKAVPAFYAARYYLGQAGVTVLMLALFGVILTSLIGNLMALSRLLYAAGREGEAPGKLGILNSRGIPVNAVLAVVAGSIIIPFLGRTAIGWIVDVTTLGATIIYGMISIGVYKHAGQAGNRQYRYAGAAGVALMAIFLMLLLVPGLLPFDAMETESYVLFIVWSVLGLIYFRILIRHDHNHEYRLRIVVWLVLLMLVLFASMMWVSRATENAAKEAVEKIFDYHESHPVDDADENIREERIAFLEEQAKSISSTNTLYTIVSLGLFILSTAIILNNYRDTRKLGKRLDEAEEAARAARKIAELKQSISSLLDNMPGLNFAKDAKTGVYLACNQAFAVYADKESPEEVIGLTDAEIFDPVTASHFRQDDSMALSMDVPYLFYEEVLDAEGHNKQFQTTKLKYVDDAGRLCLLGMSQDVTDLVRIRRENATTKEAYEKARSTGIVYTHIAQTLARGYKDLYYVNLDTEEFIEYLPGDENSVLTEEKRGEKFFDKCRTDVEVLVHPDDRAAVIEALDREKLIDFLDRNSTFIMTYRLLADSIYTYASMKVSRMEDDERFIIVGISDVDEQVRNRRAAEKMREESIAYSRLSALSGEYICVYVVAPDTDRYREYSSSEGFKTFAIPKDGEDFFSRSRKEGRKVVYREDLERYLAMFTKENVMSEIESKGFFSLTYRLVLDEAPTYVQLKAVMLEEKEGPRLIVGVSNIDAYVRQEEEYSRRLQQARSEADIDPLTGIKNRHAYLAAEKQLDLLISSGEAPEFAIVVLDLNDLKKVNDTQGHQAGDQFIRDACRIICGIFKRSPVFRVGGDEFSVIAQGDDYEGIEELIGMIDDHNTKALGTGGIVIARGMARFDKDGSVAGVYERADQRMYQNKSSLKKNS
ncbi:MAG: amino acid permease [Lachnospiraceae bacterium]|nr:amino acid permease [Lachnospiraceae bacterium]